MPGFGIEMINDDFHIAGIRRVVAERLKRVVMYSMALGPRCFKWKMLGLSGPKVNNLISKSRAFHNVGAAYTKDLSKNELAHVLLIGGTHNKQGSNDARVRIVVLLTLSLIKSHK